MLTERAMHERKWGGFPELGKILSDKQLPLEWTGPTSVSDSISQHVVRLLEIHTLVEAYSNDIEIALPGRERLIKQELLELSRALEWAAERFIAASHQIQERAKSV